MAARVMTPGRFRRLQTRARVIRALASVAFLGFSLSCGFVFVAGAIPQQDVLATYERRLEAARKQEAIVYGERDQARTECAALRDDPGFLEIHARDRLDYYREGERVFRFHRSE